MSVTVIQYNEDTARARREEVASQMAGIPNFEDRARQYLLTPDEQSLQNEAEDLDYLLGL